MLQGSPWHRPKENKGGRGDKGRAETPSKDMQSLQSQLADLQKRMGEMVPLSKIRDVMDAAGGLDGEVLLKELGDQLAKPEEKQQRCPPKHAVEAERRTKRA